MRMSDTNLGCVNQPRITSALPSPASSLPPAEVLPAPIWPVCVVLFILFCRSLGGRDTMRGRLQASQVCLLGLGHHYYLTFGWARSVLTAPIPNALWHVCVHLNFKTKSSYRAFNFGCGTKKRNKTINHIPGCCFLSIYRL